MNPPAIAAFTVMGVVLWLALNRLAFLIIGVAAAFVLAALSLIIGYLARGPIARYNERGRERREKERMEAEARHQAWLDELACGLEVRRATYEALPRERRTVALRYQHVKAKVCKPFAG